MNPFDALYGRRCRSLILWFKMDESSLLGPDLIYKILVKIHMLRYRLETDYSRQKCCANRRRKYLKFEEEDNVYLKISPMKGVSRNGN